MSIAKLDEGVLLAFGLDRVTVQALRHVLTQVGMETGGMTLPEVVLMTGAEISFEAISAELAEVRKELADLKAMMLFERPTVADERPHYDSIFS